MLTQPESFLKTSLSAKIIQVACILTKSADALLLKHTDLTYAQFKVMLTLEKHTSLSQKEVAEKLDLTQAAVSRLTEHLRHKNLVARKTNQQNRRQNVLTVTPHGHQHLQRAWKKITAAEQELFADFPLATQTELLELLDKVSSHLEKK